MTETQTVDLASWLTRIWDEEERAARAHKDSADGWLEPPPRWGPSHAYVGAPVRPKFDQIMARIAADRKILELHASFDGAHPHVSFDAEDRPYCGECGAAWPCPTVRLLASPVQGA